jgi:selenocysteine-specific elongation factor
MFKRQVQSIMQGDRAGICIGNLDAKLLERGIAATPGAIQLWKRGIALVRKVSYFPGDLLNGSKFHVSVGHATVMATVTFFGARELHDAGASEPDRAKEQSASSQPSTQPTEINTKKGKEPRLQSSSLGGDADIAGLPPVPFDFGQHFLVQEELINSLENGDKEAHKRAAKAGLLNWAKLEFQIPVFCPSNSLIIGSRLDAVENISASSSSCRLAFSGRLIEKMDADTGKDVKLYSVKEKVGVISRLGDPHRRHDDQRVVRYEIFGTDLFKAETNMKVFIGMKVITNTGDVGEIKSSFGTTGKFRVLFPGGTEAREGDPLILRFKRFVSDSTKAMHQDARLPASRPGTRLEPPKKGKKKPPPKGVKVDGEIASVKGDILENGKNNMAIVSGFFAPEVDVRQMVGWKVLIPITNEAGAIAGPFGKAGKCKVTFDNGISADVGAKAKLVIE